MKNKSEQPSKVLAEESVPKLTHVEQCMALLQSSPTDTNPVPNSRCFYTPDGSVFMGIILMETEDSFLVGCSAKMMMTKDREVTAEPLSNQAVIRIFKSSLKFIVHPQDLTAFHYYKFLEAFGYDIMPDYFTEERKAYISSVRNDPSHCPIVDTQLLEDDEVSIKVDVPGASDNAFYGSDVSERIH